jgi:hypothetical protein
MEIPSKATCVHILKRVERIVWVVGWVLHDPGYNNGMEVFGEVIFVALGFTVLLCVAIIVRVFGYEIVGSNMVGRIWVVIAQLCFVLQK